MNQIAKDLGVDASDITITSVIGTSVQKSSNKNLQVEGFSYSYTKDGTTQYGSWVASQLGEKIKSKNEKKKEAPGITWELC